MEYGIEVWTSEGWVFIIAENREWAKLLQAATVARGMWLSRLVIKTDDGFIVPTNTTA